MDLKELLAVNVQELIAPKSSGPVGISSTEIEDLGEPPSSAKVRRVVTVLNAHYLDNEGAYPTPKQISWMAKVPLEELPKLLEEVNILLEARGLPFYTTTLPGEIDPTFVAAVNLMVDPGDRRSTGAKLKLLGRTTAWWNAQLRRKTNRDYYRRQLERVFDEDIKDVAKTSLAALVGERDLSAIKYYHEFTGEFSPQAHEVYNLQLIIQVLMEILAKHVGTTVLASVADELEKSGVLQIGGKSE